MGNSHSDDNSFITPWSDRTIGEERRKEKREGLLLVVPNMTPCPMSSILYVPAAELRRMDAAQDRGFSLERKEETSCS